MNTSKNKIKQKRIRHCYPRQEVYHRFIHDNEYYYNNGHVISSKGNYLSLGDIGRDYGKNIILILRMLILLSEYYVLKKVNFVLQIMKRLNIFVMNVFAK